MDLSQLGRFWDLVRFNRGCCLLLLVTKTTVGLTLGAACGGDE